MELGALADLAINGIILIFGVVFVLLICALGYIFYQKKKKYDQFICIIWFKDMFGQLQQTIDRAGVFVDPSTNNKRFFLRKANVGLDPDNVPYISDKGKNYVYLYQKGLKNFLFIKPIIDAEKVKFLVGEEDVNWAVNTYEKHKKLFGQNLWERLVPWIVYGIIVIAVLAILIYIIQQFSVLSDVADSLIQVSDNIYKATQAQQGTLVLEGNSTILR